MAISDQSSPSSSTSILTSAAPPHGVVCWQSVRPQAMLADCRKETEPMMSAASILYIRKGSVAVELG